MRVRMRFQISGTRSGSPWPAPGETTDLPEDEAKALINLGVAEKAPEKDSVDPKEPKKEETPKPDPKPRGRPRKTPAKPAQK